MSVSMIMLIMTRLLEAVHVQLPHKRREFVVFEVTRQHFLREFSSILDNDGLAVL